MVFQAGKNGWSDLDLIVTPPIGVGEFKAADSIDYEVEWISLPRSADDYYGPKEAFRNQKIV